MNDFIKKKMLDTSQKNNLYLSESDLDRIIRDNFKTVEFKKGDFLLKEGQYCSYTTLLEKGLFMYYNLVDGEEIALDFAIEGNWISYIKSISQNIPSDISIKALEDSRVHMLHIDKMQTLFQAFPQIIQIKVTETEKSFTEMAAYNINLNTLTVEEHYKWLIETKKEWLDRVPQYYIASYLGVKPQSLSRIRKRISQNKNS